MIHLASSVRWPALLTVAVAAMAVAPAESASQETPAVVETLVGSWVGEGTLFGRTAAYRMTWEARDDGFLRLSFENGFAGDAGEVQTVLSAEATYLVTGAEAVGVWIDTRPQQLTLTAELSDTAIVTDWVAEAERGRTEYIVRSADEVVVRDHVLAEDGYRLFAEATYRRAPRTP